MTPSTSTNAIARPSTPTPQRGRPSSALHMRASCPEFGTCNHSGSSSDIANEEDLVFQSSSYSRYPNLCDVNMVDVVEVHGVTVVKVEVQDDESVYGTALVPQVELTSPGNVVRSTVTTGSPSPSRSPSKARALAKIAGKAKGIAKMLSLRRLSRKPSMDASIPMVSSTSAVAVSGTWQDSAGSPGQGGSHASPRRPPISILITSESMTDAITYHMSPGARITSSSSTTGIYTPDDDCPHDLDCPRSPTPSPVSFGPDAARRFERALLYGDGDLFADMPKRRPALLGAPSNRNVNSRAADPQPAQAVDAARPSALTARPQQAPEPPKSHPFPNILRLLLFMPWCIAVGATITLFPAHIERVVFSTGYIPAPGPRGVARFCFWADTARDYACIFGFTLLSLFFVSVPAGWVMCALALGRFVWVWGAYACANREKCCCVHAPERLGEDDMESLALIARGGDVANLVLRQCAGQAGPALSRR